MKKLFLILTLFLNSCSFYTTRDRTYDYHDVQEYTISINDLFNAAKVGYFVYFYSQSCFHCESIKEAIIKFCLDEIYPTYFIEYDKQITICSNIENTIGVTVIEDLCILGTPTLIELYQGKIIKNIAGSSSILKFLENH